MNSKRILVTGASRGIGLELVKMFSDLVQAVRQSDSNVKASTDILISGMIGIALCINTVRDYPWADAMMMTDRLLTGIISPINTTT